MDNHLIDESDCILKDLIVVLDELMCLMKEEHECVITYNISKIYELNKKKNDLLLKIKVLESAKDISMQKIARALGIQGQVSSKFIIERIPDKQRAEDLSQKISCLVSLAQAVQEFNDIQREYIQLSLNTIHAEMMILGQMEPSGSCYNKQAEISGKSKGSMGGMMDQSI